MVFDEALAAPEREGPRILEACKVQGRKFVLLDSGQY